MTNNPNIINEPHVVCHLTYDGRLRADTAVPGFGLDDRFAIYPTRHEANASLRYFNTGDILHFTVPAEALFDRQTVTTEVFTLKGE